MSQIRDKKAHRKHIATMNPINAKSVQLIELHAFAYCLLSVSLSESFDFLKYKVYTTDIQHIEAVLPCIQQRVLNYIKSYRAIMIRAKIIFCSQRKKDFLNHFYGSILLFLT